jgi:hypothetical protein
VAVEQREEEEHGDVAGAEDEHEDPQLAEGGDRLDASGTRAEPEDLIDQARGNFSG